MIAVSPSPGFDPITALVLAFAGCFIAIVCLAAMLLGVMRGWVITRQRFYDMQVERDSWRNWYLRGESELKSATAEYKRTVDKLIETNERAMDMLRDREP